MPKRTIKNEIKIGLLTFSAAPRLKTFGLLKT